MSAFWRVLLAVAASATSLAAGGSTAVHATPLATAASYSYMVPNAVLDGVAATSPSNAWAVGYFNPNRVGVSTPLLLHWNGSTWQRMTIPNFPGQLMAVAAVSANNAWAVGSDSGTNSGAIVLHWNGRGWTTADLVLNLTTGYAVAATARDVWVACYNGSVNGFLHMTSGHWYVVPVGVPRFYQPSSIALISHSLAWAAGSYFIGYSLDSFLLRWNGSVWQSMPDPLQRANIFGMASGPNGAVWAVGSAQSVTNGALSMLWNGSSWQKVVNPGLGGFRAVTFIPGGTAWAVGWAMGPGSPTMIAQWTGSTWQQVAAPGHSGDLFAVTATSAQNAWAVGDTNAGTLIMHWNGSTWS